MKIARNVAVSDRHVERYAPHPGSLREGAGNGWCHSTGYSLKSGVAGDFHRPYEGSETGSFYHSTDDTPSVSPSGCQLPQRGSREWLVPFNRVLAEIRGCGRFSSPLRRAGSIHRSALPQRGSREWLVPFNRVLAGIRGCGRFSSPLRRCGIWHGVV